MTAVTIESLGIEAKYVEQYRAEIAASYRTQREIGKDSPVVAAGTVMRFRADVIANGWVEFGEVNKFSGLAYLIACEWHEAAWRLNARRARKAVAA